MEILVTSLLKRAAGWGCVAFVVHALLLAPLLYLSGHGPPNVAGFANAVVAAVDYPVEGYAGAHSTQDKFIPVFQIFLNLGFEWQAAVTATVIVEFSLLGGAFYFVLATMLALVVLHRRARRVDGSTGADKA